MTEQSARPGIGHAPPAKAGTPNLGRAVGPKQRGFTLVEIMVVVSLLSLIVYGLYNMFSQTQRALRSNNSQVDILESGRSTMELLTREMGETAYSGLVGPLMVPHVVIGLDYAKPLLQPLIDGTVRTNVLQSCFFLTRPDNHWAANGFFVASTTNVGNSVTFTTNQVDQLGMGTLYRFVTPVMPEVNGPIYLTPATNLLWLAQFLRAKTAAYLADATNSAVLNPAYPVTDGVVSFRVRPCDQYGQPITLLHLAQLKPYQVPAAADPLQPISSLQQAVLQQPYLTNAVRLVPETAPTARGFERSSFAGTNLPAYLEVELGILDPQVVAKVRALSNPVAQRNFLTNQVSAVHLFHRLIPLRNAQPWPQ